jgi:hypothetical protein
MNKEKMETLSPVEKINLIGKAYTTKKVDDDRELIYIHNEEQPKEFQEAIKDIQFNLNEETGNFELDYEIMANACDNISIYTPEELEEVNFNEDTYASPYTATRLSYLNINNQEEISTICRGYGIDIQAACADWYDEKVVRACDMLRDYILEENK